MIEQQEKNNEQQVSQSPIVANEPKSEVTNPEGQNHRPGNFNNFNNRGGARQPFNKNGRSNRDNNRFNKDDHLFEEKVVTINRVTKVTKGGRHFRFAAVVVIGDKKGKVGFGTGKANEVPDAIKKAIKEARKALVTVPLVGTTVPHEVIGHFGSGRVLIKPAKKGTGVIAGGPVRAVIELSGLADVYTKSLGTNTPINMIRATIAGLQSLRTVKQIAYLRDKSVEELHK